MNEEIKIFEMRLKEEEKAENTISKYLRDVKEFYTWLASRGEPNNRRGCKPCEPVLTKEALLTYKESLKLSNLKTSTINSKISALNAYFNYMRNGTLKLKLLKCQKSLFSSEEKELTRYDYKRLYDACKENVRLKLIIETISQTGIRVSELKYITYGSLITGKTVVENKGKIRVILLPRKLCKKLLDYAHKGDYFGPVFVTRKGNTISRKQIWQMLKSLAEKTGMSREKVFPHNLRHLFAREFYKSTHDIVKLASLLGHSSIETTRIYAKSTEEECRAELERAVFAKE